MGRPPCCDKSNVKKGLWTPEEDAKILNYVASHGTGNWTLIPKKAGLNRCGKSCRLRWTNYLRPDLKHDSFSPQEEQSIIELHKAIGSRWSLIAKRLPGRTDNDVKNYWNTKLKKKLIKMGIDPVTHKPVSQVLSDYGDISCRGNSSTPCGSFSKHFNTISIRKPESSDSVLSSVSTTEMIAKPLILLTQETNSHVPTNSSSDSLHQPLFTDKKDTIHPHFLFNDIMFPRSSSSSANIPQLNMMYQPQVFTPQSSLCWSEFLVPDPVFPLDIQKQEEFEPEAIFSPAPRSSTTMQCETHKSMFNIKNENQSYKMASEVSEAYVHSAASSFVDEILNRDSEIQSQFPQLLDAYFNY